jgi:hypothetical protein
MASSYTESEDSEECEADSEVEDSNNNFAEPQKYDTLKKELEEEERVSGVFYLHYSRLLAFGLHVEYLCLTYRKTLLMF